MTTIVWDEENEFVRFEDLDPDWDACLEGNSTAAIITNGLTKLVEPIWLHPSTAYELAEASIIDPWQETAGGPPATAEIDGVTVHLYMGPF